MEPIGEGEQRWWNFEAECAAVGKLMTQSSFVDCTTGRSEGFFPLQDATHIDSKLTVGIRYARAVAHVASLKLRS